MNNNYNTKSQIINKRSNYSNNINRTSKFYKNNRGNMRNRTNKSNNLSNTNSKSASNSKSSINYLALFMRIVIYLLIIAVVSYIIAFTIKYCRTKCFDKKSYGDYLFGFCWTDVCNTPLYNTKTNVYKVDKNIVNNSGNNCENNDNCKRNNISGKKDKKMQVFNIENQDYTYDQARCKCESYGAKLANYDQIVNAYNNGAEWCTYGWSDGQNAYYPTQKCTWDEMQRGPEKDRNNCGKPGINGGFFSDPYLKFGVNCYGIKPAGEVAKLKKPFCKKKPFCERKDNYNASHQLSTDKIAPFNSNQWNQ